MPSIPTCPETLGELQARYPRCLEHVYNCMAVAFGGAIRPGECAGNVFDFEDGLRLIISLERLVDGEVRLHVSASIPQDCAIADELRRLVGTMPAVEILERFAARVPGRFAELSGDPAPLRFIGRDPTGIPHWVRNWRPA